MKLFGGKPKEKNMAGSVPDAVREPMKIRVSNIETLDVYYKGKKARFGGELVGKGFLAYADSMRWMEPVRDVPVSDEDREEWVGAIKRYSASDEIQVFFEENAETDIKRAENYWKKQEYGKAGKLFEKHTESLTAVQLKKLEYIKTHFPEKQ